MKDHLKYYLQQWNLQATGDPITTYSGILQPVLYNGVKCMLKIARREKDIRANKIMIWWNGDGAAKILLHDGPSLLMEYADNKVSLAEMAKNGKDSEASLILCSTIQKLHQHKPPYPGDLIPLKAWFKHLIFPSGAYNDLINSCREIAVNLLDNPQDTVALHGDIHHGNVLHFDKRGCLAIDPKGLIGERSFDYANIFCNPNGIIATKPGRLAEQATVVAKAAAIHRVRLLQWIAAWAALSAVWCISDKQNPENALRVARLALNSLPSQ